MFPVNNNSELIDLIQKHGCPRFLYFWGHTQSDPAVVDQSCLSQWYPSPIQFFGVTYASAEHYMMAQKAALFGDHEIEAQILQTSNPADAKALGRKIRDFNEEKWEHERLRIVFEGNFFKFSQHPELEKFLLNTGDAVLVEASPVDKIWGIGLAASDPKSVSPNQWEGQNLLGYILMKVRGKLLEIEDC